MCGILYSSMEWLCKLDDISDVLLRWGCVVVVLQWWYYRSTTLDLTILISSFGLRKPASVGDSTQRESEN